MSPRAAGGREALASQGGNHVMRLSPGTLRWPPCVVAALLRVPPSFGRGDMSVAHMPEGGETYPASSSY